MSETKHSKQELCDQVDAQMTDVLEGTAADELYDHLAECDRCRDARYDAERAEQLCADAGVDFTLPADLEQRVLAAVDGTEGGAATDDPIVSGVSPVDVQPPAPTVPGEPLEPELPSPATSSEPPPTAGETEVADEQGDRPKPSESKAEQQGKVVKPERWTRKPRNVILLGLVGAAAAAAAVSLAVRPQSTEEETRAAASAPWEGRVVKISRAAGGEGGLELCNSAGEQCVPATTDEPIEAGRLLRTDDRTRAYIELGDGTRLALDRSTELSLTADANRTGKLLSGALVAEVAKVKGLKARFELPHGHLDVLGTKFALRSSNEAAAVDVSRGAVRLVDEQNRGVTVRAGEEGRMYPGVAPYATGAPALSEALSWSDEPEGDKAEDIVVRGLGELRAKKPGTDKELQGAVRLDSHKVKVRIVDGFARTEIDETFTNTTGDVLEGIYRFPLPPDAQIERLALEVDGHLEEGAFVDRDRAAAIWRGAIVTASKRRRPIREEIIWVPGPWKDPALLEWQRGGRFELRIYPIPRRGSRRVVLTYTQVIKPSGSVRRYVYPLGHDPGGSSRVGEFAVDVQVRGHDPSYGVSSQGYALTAADPSGGAERLNMRANQFVPSGDLVVEYALAKRDQELTAWAYQSTNGNGQAQADADAGKATGGKAATTKPKATKSAPSSTDSKLAGADDQKPYVAIALRPQLPRSTQQLERAYVFVLDASRSMFGERYRRASALAVKVIKELDRLDRFTLLACDTTCRQLPGGLQPPSQQTALTASKFLDGIKPEGGSDLTAAIRQASAAASDAAGRSVRVVYIGDGTPTVGAIRPRYLTQAVSQAMSSGTSSLTAVAIGADADLDALGALARGGGGVVLPYVPGQRVSEAAYAILGASYGTGLRDISLELPDGLVATAPQKLDTIPVGGQALVVARMEKPELSGEVVLRGKVGKQDFEQRYPLNVVASKAAGNAFVPRLYAALRIADLERKGTAEARTQAVKLSGRFNVASRYTSLLVLESPAMFRAFGLDNTRRVAEWTGEEQTESSTAGGKMALGPDDRDFGEMSGFGAADGPSASGANKMYAAKAAKKPMRPFSTELDDAKDKSFDPPSPPVMPSSLPQPRPTATMAKPMPPRKTGSANCSPNDLMCQMRAGQSRRPPPPRWRGGRRWVPMRRIWERHANISTSRTVPFKAAVSKIVDAEREAEKNENRRGAVKKLYTLYALAGNLSQAKGLADKWSDKEPLDPEALTARADMAAREGNREQAIRILGSVVDVRPGDVNSQKRLARLHRWAGTPALGCRHSIAIAQLREKDAKLLAEAVRCAQSTGESQLGHDMLAAVDDKTRRAADKLLAKNKGQEDKLRGELRMEATWDSPVDLDISLIHPDGHRVSWLGAPTKAVITARDVTNTGREGLALRGVKAGEYVIEIVRGSGEGRVRGSLSVVAPRKRQSISFELAPGVDRVTVGLVSLQWRSRLVPM